MPVYNPPASGAGGPPSGAAGGDLAGTYPDPAIGTGVIVDADVNASAAIAKSKLAALAIVNADVDAAAAIAKSKLAALAIAAGDVDGTLKPSGTAAVTDESLRRLGTGATHAAAGDDSRFPSTGQKNALAGTAGTPGTGNEYATKQTTDALQPVDSDLTSIAALATTSYGRSLLEAANAAAVRTLAAAAADTVDAAAGTGSLRTLGTSSTSAAAGNDSRLPAGADIVDADVSASAAIVTSKLSLANPVPSFHVLKAWTEDVIATGGASGMNGNGVMHVRRIVIAETVTVANLLAETAVAGATLTAARCFGGLYTSGGTLIAKTADQKTPWEAAAGLKTMALTAEGGQSLTITGPTTVFASIMSTGSTNPTWIRIGAATAGTADLVNVGLSASTYRVAVTASQGSASAPPSTLPALTADQKAIWMGLS